MKILYAAFEVLPFTKVGGLADVMGALPKYVADEKTQVAIFTPLTGSIDEKKYKIKEIENSKIKLKFGFAEYVFSLKMCKLPNTDINVFFVENPKFFSCFKTVYPLNIDSWYEQERFITFSKVVLEYAKALNFKPDIIHCNDWHTAMIPVWLKTTLKNDEFYKNSKTVFSIHNLAYQGKYFPEILEVAGLNKEEVFLPDGLEHNGVLNWLKGAINYSDKIVTVSPCYAEEILTKEYGEGLEDVLIKNKHKLCGILNGVDYDEFNPKTDKTIRFNYDINEIENKEKCKQEILKEFSLSYVPNRPLIAMISRLVEQKGIDLLMQCENDLINLEADFIIIGTGEEKYENFFKSLNQKSANIRAKIHYCSELSGKIYSGADIFLMPSRFEPCGLSQLIALKYGTVPVVHATGGLDNTIISYPQKNANGFKFTNYNPNEMISALKNAIALYKNKNAWQNLMKTGMLCDYSWEKGAGEYKKLYNGLIVKKYNHSIG